MQNKVDILVDIIKSIRSNGQKNLALKIIADLVKIINDQGEEVKKLLSVNYNIPFKYFDTEMEKYITALSVYGYSQDSFKGIDTSTLVFISKHKGQLNRLPDALAVYNTQTWLRMFELDNDRQPFDFVELKKYIENAVKG